MKPRIGIVGGKPKNYPKDWDVDLVHWDQEMPDNRPPSFKGCEFIFVNRRFCSHNKEREAKETAKRLNIPVFGDHHSGRSHIIMAIERNGLDPARYFPDANKTQDDLRDIQKSQKQITVQAPAAAGIWRILRDTNALHSPAPGCWSIIGRLTPDIREKCMKAARLGEQNTKHAIAAIRTFIDCFDGVVPDEFLNKGVLWCTIGIHKLGKYFAAADRTMLIWRRLDSGRGRAQKWRFNLIPGEKEEEIKEEQKEEITDESIDAQAVQDPTTGDELTDLALAACNFIDALAAYAKDVILRKVDQ